MHTLVFNLGNPNLAYRLLKFVSKTTHFQKKCKVLSNLMDLKLSQKSYLNIPLERSSQELLNSYLSFKIRQS